MSPLNVRRRSTRSASVLAAATVAASTLGLVAQAHATQVSGDVTTFTVSDGIEGGQAPVNGPDDYRVDVASISGQSVWKLTTETPIRLVTGACTRITGANNVAGPSEIHCKRADAPGESRAILAGGDDQFIAAPGFPDRLRLVGEDGNDVLVGGLADDVINGGDGDNTLTGNEGNDSLTLGSPPRTQFGSFPNGDNTLTGGPGDDVIFGGDGNDTVDGGPGNDSLGGGRGVDSLLGGDGDDFLNGTEDAFQKRDLLSGGAGTDRFIGDVLDQISARDGIQERISCKPVRFLSDPLAFTEVDLKDIIEFGDTCSNVLRAPKDEKPAALPGKGSVKVSGRRARVRITCTTPAATCIGTVQLALSGKRSAMVASAPFQVDGGQSRTVDVMLGKPGAKKVTRKGKPATLTLTEAGVAGERTVTRSVKLKR